MKYDHLVCIQNCWILINKLSRLFHAS